MSLKGRGRGTSQVYGIRLAQRGGGLLQSREVPEIAPQQTIAVLGAGSWGTALAFQAARTGTTVRLWSRDAAQVEAMQNSRHNPRYLTDLELPSGVQPTADLGEALHDASAIIIAVPSHGMRGILEQVAPVLRGREQTDLLIAAKGIEAQTLLSMFDLAMECFAGAPGVHVSVLGGPSFAREVAIEAPTVVVFASPRVEAAERLQLRLSTEAFRVYVSADVVGVELGGALKNVIALAAGMCDGAGLGTNARAALITRGLAEITRLGVAMGAEPGTFAGLAGLGDLVLTCTGSLSRNRQVGLALGKGERIDEVVSKMGMVAEGVKNTANAVSLAARHGVAMPIVEVMDRILREQTTVEEAVRELMSRELKSEPLG